MLPEKWRGSEKLNTFGGEQNMNIINEAGLYKLVMRSNKPIAQKFQEVVCEEILPSLRKKGEYQIQSILDKNKNKNGKKINNKKKLKTKIRKLYFKIKGYVNEIHKKSAKYFLTILGDAILKKSGDLIFLVKLLFY